MRKAHALSAPEDSRVQTIFEKLDDKGFYRSSCMYSTPLLLLPRIYGLRNRTLSTTRLRARHYQNPPLREKTWTLVKQLNKCSSLLQGRGCLCQVCVLIFSYLRLTNFQNRRFYKSVNNERRNPLREPILRICTMTLLSQSSTISSAPANLES